MHLQPGPKRIDELADFVEWIANAKPEDEQAIRAEIKRYFCDVGDRGSCDALNAHLTALLKPGITPDDRQRILNLMDVYTRADPAEWAHIRDWGTAAAVAAGGVPPSAAGERAGAEAATEEAATVGGTPNAATDAEAWKSGWAARGRYFEDRLGRTLHPNFPRIDKIPEGIATSIKSIDLNAATYQNANSLRYRLNDYVDKVESFKGRTWGDDEVAESDITGRALHVAIPKGSMSEKQRAVFEEARERARKLPHPVDIIVTEF